MRTHGISLCINSRPRHRALAQRATGLRHEAGLSLFELMISVAISLTILVALVTVFVNTSRNNAELARTNSQIENGRFAMQLLQGELAHAGFWGTHMPQFDDLTLRTIPGDVPASVPDPCLAYNATNWNSSYKSGLLGIAVQAYDAAPAGCSAVVTDQEPNTDVLVVRHAETCVAGSGGNCAADTAGAVYFQTSQCAAELVALARSGSTSSTLNMAASASAVDDAYAGMTVRIVSGTGAGQSRAIATYSGASKEATVDAAWTTTPDATSVYSLESVINTAGFNLRKRDCASAADKRKFISTIYYVRSFASTAGDGIPTLVQSRFDLQGGTLAHPATVTPLVEGIEGFRVELGIDNLSDTGSAANFTQAVTWASATSLTSPTNRGDGIADGAFVRCTTASPCTTAQLINVVGIKLYLVSRSRESTPGYTDTKTYTLGSTSWTVPGGSSSFKRHVYSGSVRMTNISGRRETP
jgi:Tfp pilus assembly protein PilW